MNKINYKQWVLIILSLIIVTVFCGGEGGTGGSGGNGIDGNPTTPSVFFSNNSDINNYGIDFSTSSINKTGVDYISVRRGDYTTGFNIRVSNIANGVKALSETPTITFNRGNHFDNGTTIMEFFTSNFSDFKINFHECDRGESDVACQSERKHRDLMVLSYQMQTLPTLTIYYVNGAYARNFNEFQLQAEFNSIIKQAVSDIRIEWRQASLDWDLNNNEKLDENEFEDLLNLTRNRYLWDTRRPGLFILPTREPLSFHNSHDLLGIANYDFAVVGEGASMRTIIHEALHLQSIADLRDVNETDNLMNGSANNTGKRLRYHPIVTVRGTTDKQWGNLRWSGH